jgi:ribonuclease III
MIIEIQKQQDLLRNLNIIFHNKNLLIQAFVHRSYINENQNFSLGNNERLEYLGDAVLELVITHALFLQFPNKPEGQLTAYRAALVRTETIGKTAANLGFSEYLMLSKGEKKDIGRAREYILANTYEAFIGALYLDQGYEAVKTFIEKTLLPQLVEIIDQGLWRDAKSWVQEKAQELFNVTPTYLVVSDEGPDHNKVFQVGIKFKGEEIISIGEGKSKQEAEQKAARAALEKFHWHELKS